MKNVLFQFAAPIISKRLLKECVQIPESNEDVAMSQNNILHDIIGNIAECEMGKSKGINSEVNANEMQNIPITNYENYIPYIENIKDGKPNQLWHGMPLYMAETSGSTGTKKFIPVTKEILQNQLNGRRNVVANVINLYGAKRILNSPPLSFGEAPLFNQFGKLKSAAISAILASQMPRWSKYFSRPTMPTRAIPLFKDRIESIYNEIAESPPGFIVAMPAWLRDFFSSLSSEQLQRIISVNPVLNLSGMNPQPYISYFENLFGGQLDFVESYPASEGFFGWQDRKNEPGIRLYMNDGIYYELLYTNGDTKPITKTQVGDSGELVITTCGGLFRYCMGDLITIVSHQPIRISIIGRKAETLSSFGEHLLSSETDSVIKNAAEYFQIPLFDYIVCPAPIESKIKSHHIWYIETDAENLPENISEFINQQLCKLNIRYRDLYHDGVLIYPEIITLKPNTIMGYYKSKGHIGLQQKLPRLVREDMNKLRI